MSERKVLNKYYPPDFDPSKIPKLRLPRNRQYSIRIMAPFNMKCNTCGEYIYKGKKFNSRKETVEDEDYLGLRIFRFYIKCPRCVAEIAFKTDPQNTDYELEDGATRNFEASKTAERLAEAEAKAIEEEEANNPMKVLENRTKASQREMEMLETLEDLRELNSRHAKVDHENMILMATAYKEQLARLQEEEDEKFINSIFKKEDNIKRLPEDDEDEKVVEPPVKIRKSDKPTDLLAQDSSKSGSGAEKKEPASWEKSVGILSKSKTSLAMMVKRKTPSNPSTKPAPAPTPQTGAAPVAGRSVNGTTEPTVGRSKSETSPETVGLSNVDSSDVKTVAPVVIPSSTGQSSSGLSGLGMLGDYSDSDSNGSDDS